MKPVPGVIACLLLVIGAACVMPASQNVPWQAARRPDCPYPGFDGTRDIEETGSIEESGDSCWWLSSGGTFQIDHGVGRTLQGALPAGAMWRERYAKSSAEDTDEGQHPQNLLRLVTRARWRDHRQEVRFRIARINQSASRERGEWSGVLMFNRYQDSQNLYYAGLRMDGMAVIKKKLNGHYTTLAQAAVFGPPQSFDRDRNPSLLPAGRWVSMASTVRTEPDGSVRLRLLVRDEAGNWQQVVEAVDAGAGGEPIREPGHAGLRADFMDVEFTGYAAGNSSS